MLNADTEVLLIKPPLVSISNWLSSSNDVTDNNDVIRDDNALRGTTITNKTGNYGLNESRTGMHGGSHTTCYPAIMQIDWWGTYGNNDSTYGGKGHSGTDA